MNKINRKLQQNLNKHHNRLLLGQDFNQNNFCNGIYDFQKSGCLLLCKGPAFQMKGTESVTLAPSLKMLGNITVVVAFPVTIERSSVC